jgi:RNA polymerase primary sigma factor
MSLGEVRMQSVIRHKMLSVGRTNLGGHEGEQVKRDTANQLLSALAGRLDGASIRRSAIEETITSAVGGADMRRHVEGLLAQAGISVVEDVGVVIAPCAHDDVREAQASAVVDPLESARRRLDLDHGRTPGRLAKILLKADEEVGLTLLARPEGEPLESGDFARLTGEAKEAADAMLLHNMGLIHSVAQRLQGQGLDYDELVASGIPGLIRAIELFDPFRGLKFSTYAMNWVRQSVGRAIDDEGRIVRLPVYVCESIRKVRAAQLRLTSNGRLPRWDELAQECDMTVEKVQMLLALSPHTVSLETPVGQDGFTLGDLLDRPVRSEEHVEVHGLFPEDVEPLLMELPEREADIVRRRFGLKPYDEAATLEEIGTAHGVTRERVRQLETKAFDHMGAVLRKRGFDAPERKKKRTPTTLLAAS